MAEANQFVQSLLGQRLRVEIDDGRMIVGEFYCLDRDLNVVLYDASETRSSGNSINLGMVVVPGIHIKGFYIRHDTQST